MALDISFSPENLLYKEALTADIRLVFFHTVRSDRDSLVMSCPGDPERLEIRDPYATFAWDEVAEQLFRTECDVLYFFAPEGFRYYLSAFTHSLSELYNTKERTNDMQIWSLTHRSEDAYFRTEQLARFTGFSFAQGSVILHFPEYMEAYHNGDFINLTNNNRNYGKPSRVGG